MTSSIASVPSPEQKKHSAMDEFNEARSALYAELDLIVNQLNPVLAPFDPGPESPADVVVSEFEEGVASLWRLRGLMAQLRTRIVL